jgi:hypothetical protein
MSMPEPEPAYKPDHDENAMDDEEDEDFDDLNGRLAQLIADGQRALGTAVVVASESAEDAVDDGLGEWADEDPPLGSGSTSAPRGTISRGGSIRKRRPRSLVQIPASPSHTGTNTASPRVEALSSTLSPSMPFVPSMLDFGDGVPGGVEPRSDSVDSVRKVKEETQTWESPEMREFMQRARAMRGL